ncbi:hypothetical protein OROMI_028097 [Orobanche minor]
MTVNRKERREGKKGREWEKRRGRYRGFCPHSSSSPILFKDPKQSTTQWALRPSRVRSFNVPTYNNKNEVAGSKFISQDKECNTSQVKSSKNGDETNCTT